MMRRTAPALMPCAVLGAAFLALSGCTPGKNSGAVQVDVVGLPQQIAEPLRDNNPPAAKTILGAVAQGLLSYDANGQIVDALVESWIVEDGGQSYIFRLKRLEWPDGARVKAEEVVKLLRERFRANPLWLAGLKPDIRAMTDRVIEIRLDADLPTFLQLLAQPQFGVLSRAGGTGPYRPANPQTLVDLVPVQTGDVDEPVRPLERRTLHARRAALAFVRFKAGKTDLVLGGRFQHLPLVSAAGLPMTDLRVDPVVGLFGLGFTGSSDFLADGAIRDALARTIDRGRLAQMLALPGWATAEYPLPASMELDRQPSAPAWTGRPMAERVASARQVIQRWVTEHGDPPLLRIALPDGPGASLLFIRIAQDFAQLGVRVDRVAQDDPADLRLIDEVAPFDSALWFLARLDCPAKLTCDPAASDLLDGVRKAANEAEQATLLGEAEQKIVEHAGFIPLGQPIRFALAAKRLTGFQLSPRAVHPLNRLFAIPN